MRSHRALNLDPRSPASGSRSAHPLVGAALGLLLANCSAPPGALPSDAATPPRDAAAAVDAPAQDLWGDAAARDLGLAGDAGALLPPVACGAVLPGPAMKPDLIEAQPGYAAAAAALDLQVVPDPYSYAGLAAFQMGVVNFMLGRASGTTLTGADAAAAGPLGQSVLAAVAQGGGTSLDFAFLRRGLQYAYLCSRPVPRDLGELRARYGDYETWPTQVIDCSKPKNGPRRLRENPALGVYVSETLVNGQVRETEALFTDLRRDGHLSFAQYTDAGQLTDRSTFATATASVTSGSPYTCLTCHYDRNSGTFSLRLPTGTGAGCR